MSVLLGAALPLAGCGSDGDGDSAPAPATVPIDGPVPDDCITDTSAGRQELECEGLRFDLNVPAQCLDASCGLIVDVHGFGMNSTLEELHTQLAALGEQHGFVVMQPTAPGTIGSTSWLPDNDEQVLAIMRRVMGVFQVDDRRVHMTGYSQGGFMTWRFTCAQSELLASVAPMAAGSGGCFQGERPSQQIDILYGHGTTDGLVDFASAGPSRDGVIAAFGLREDGVVSEDAEHRWTRYANDDGDVLEFIQWDWETDFLLGTRPLLGHCFPGSAEFLGCGETNAFNWGEAVIQFFIDHPKD